MLSHTYTSESLTVPGNSCLYLGGPSQTSGRTSVSSASLKLCSCDLDEVITALGIGWCVIDVGASSDLCGNWRRSVGVRCSCPREVDLVSG